MLYRLIIESISSSLNELWTNKLRTFLSLLGISIGIFCVIAVFAAVDSMEQNIKSSFEKLGSNVIYISKWPWAFNSDYPWWKYINRPSGNNNEMAELQGRLKSASAIAITETVSNKSVNYNGTSVDNISVNGVSQDYNRVMKFDFASGRYFTQMESDDAAKVVIVGADIAASLFPPGTDPLGQEINVLGSKLRVIGVLKKEGESIVKISNDDLLIVPFNFITTKIDKVNPGTDPTMLAQAKPGVSLDELSDELEGLMRGIRREPPRKEDNFALNRISMITDFISQIFGTLDVAGLIIGTFALLVGGFGIANIMFVSVRERTNLIGIKKAIGAKNYFILLEFLTEAVILSIIGGIFGLVLVYVCAIIFGRNLNFPLILSQKNIVMGLSISMLIGVIAGLWPALSAARLKPVDAIRFK